MLNIETSLLNEKYEFFTGRGLGVPQSKQGYIVAKSETKDIKIQKAEDFSQVVTGITSPEEALEYVRLLTSSQIHPYLSDVHYQEVQTPAQRIASEPEEEEQKMQEQHCVMISQEQYDAWKVAEPVVKEEEQGIYTIERFVASYPKMDEQTMTPAQLLKIREWVDAQGKYRMEVQDVIAEGADVQKILPFTK